MEKNIIFKVISMLKGYYQEPIDINDMKAELDEYTGDNKEQAIIDVVTSKMMVSIAEEISELGILSEEEIMAEFNKDE